MCENLEKISNNSLFIKYKNTDNVVDDICSIIESARNYAYQSVNIALVERNWFIGYRIAEEELKGNDRADYGIELIKKLSHGSFPLYPIGVVILRIIGADELEKFFQTHTLSFAGGLMMPVCSHIW